jgi:uncharacterized membrane protein YukC
MAGLPEGWGKEMDAEEHLGTYQSFLAVTKWTGIGVIILLVLMAIFLL